MVKIRLRRMGAKKAPFYRVVVADSRFARDGRFIEEIGYYDPTKEPSVVKIDAEKAKQWLDNGAQPTDTVREILKKAAVLEFVRFSGRERHMQELLLAVARGLVEDKEAVQVTVDPMREDGTVVYHLKVAEADMGRVIGKQGRIAKAIRVVVRAAAVRQGEKVIVEID